MFFSNRTSVITRRDDRIEKKCHRGATPRATEQTAPKNERTCRGNGRSFRFFLIRNPSRVYVAGEKLFVDYSGQTVPLTDPDTGEEKQAQVFVAVMGASSYTYAEATMTQSLPDWLGSHVCGELGVNQILILTQHRRRILTHTKC